MFIPPWLNQQPYKISFDVASSNKTYADLQVKVPDIYERFRPNLELIS
jgi:hypothetical protein